MNIAVDLQNLLAEKLELLLNFERLTELLTECDVSAMNDYITKRRELANRIDIITDNILILCDKADITPCARDIIANKCDFSDVCDEWQPVFTLSQSILACVNRCIEVNDLAYSRMQALKNHFEKRIKETNNTPKIIRYLSASGAKIPGGDISIKNMKI